MDNPEGVVENVIHQVDFLLEKFRGGPSMSLKQIKLVYMVIITAFDGNRVPKESSYSFHSKLFFSLLEFSILSYCDLSSALLLGDLCSLVLRGADNSSSIWAALGSTIHNVTELVEYMAHKANVPCMYPMYLKYGDNERAERFVIENPSQLYSILVFLYGGYGAFCRDRSAGHALSPFNTCFDSEQIFLVLSFLPVIRSPVLCINALLELVSEECVLRTLHGQSLVTVIEGVVETFASTTRVYSCMDMSNIMTDFETMCYLVVKFLRRVLVLHAHSFGTDVVAYCRAPLSATSVGNVKSTCTGGSGQGTSLVLVLTPVIEKSLLAMAEDVASDISRRSLATLLYALYQCSVASPGAAYISFSTLSSLLHCVCSDESSVECVHAFSLYLCSVLAAREIRDAVSCWSIMPVSAMEDDNLSSDREERGTKRVSFGSEKTPNSPARYLRRRIGSPTSTPSDYLPIHLNEQDKEEDNQWSRYLPESEHHSQLASTGKGNGQRTSPTRHNEPRRNSAQGELIQSGATPDVVTFIKHRTHLLVGRQTSKHSETEVMILAEFLLASVRPSCIEETPLEDESVLARVLSLYVDAMRREMERVMSSPHFPITATFHTVAASAGRILVQKPLLLSYFHRSPTGSVERTISCVMERLCRVLLEKIRDLSLPDPLKIQCSVYDKVRSEKEIELSNVDNIAGDIIDCDFTNDFLLSVDDKVHKIYRLVYCQDWYSVYAYIVSSLLCSVTTDCSDDDTLPKLLCHSLHNTGGDIWTRTVYTELEDAFNRFASTYVFTEPYPATDLKSFAGGIIRLVPTASVLVSEINIELSSFHESSITISDPSALSKLRFLDAILGVAIRYMFITKFSHRVHTLLSSKYFAADSIFFDLNTSMGVEKGVKMKRNVGQFMQEISSEIGVVDTCKVLMLAQAATNIDGWCNAMDIFETPHSLTTTVMESESEALCRQLVQTVYRLAKVCVESMVGRISSDCLLKNSCTDEEPYQMLYLEYCSLIRLLTSLRLWCGLERCAVRSLSILSMGKELDNVCKLLSEHLPPHADLAQSVSELLGVGLLDASFKWREGIDVDDRDIWWGLSCAVGVQPLGLLHEASVAVKRASETLSHDEYSRTTNDNKSVAAATASGDVETKHDALSDVERRRLTTSIWICVSAFKRLILNTFLTEPQIALWGLSALLLQPSDECPLCDWLYHMILETFLSLSLQCPENPSGSAGDVVKGGLIYRLLTGDHAQLAADIFFRPLLQSPALMDMMSRVASRCGYDIQQLICDQFAHIMHSVILYHDNVAFLTLRHIFRSMGVAAMSGHQRSSTQRRISGSLHKDDRTNNKTGLGLHHTGQQQSMTSFHTLIDKNPLCIFRILSSDDVMSMDVYSLIEGGIAQCLENIYAAPLNSTLYATDTLSSESVPLPGTGVVQRILRFIVWHLGSHSSSVVTASRRALRIICTLIKAGEWRVRSHTMVHRKSRRRVENATDEQDISMDLDNNVADILNANFLYIITNSIQRNWFMKRVAVQVHSMRVLRGLLQLLKPDDIVKFLPKIMHTIDTALGCKNSSVRIVGVLLIQDLCVVLPDSVIRDNAALLITGLYPLIEDFPAEVGYTSDSGDHNEKYNARWNKTVLDAAEQDMKVQCQNIVKTGGSHHEGDILEVPEPSSSEASMRMESFCRVMYAGELAAREVEKARILSIDTIAKLFETRWDVIEPTMQTIVRLPNLKSTLRPSGVDGLARARNMHKLKLRQMTFETSLSQLCDMLRLESAQLRVMALEGLTALCSRHRHQLLSEISTGVTASLLSRTMMCVLQLCARESESKVRVAIAQCLGELGALDPAKVAFVLNSPTMGGAYSAPISDNISELTHPPPWRLDAYSFSMMLLEKQLVPGLKMTAANVYGQDRVCYAIQQILRIMASYSETSPLRTTLSVPTDLPMPDSLRNELLSKEILDYVLPYWSTNYTFKEEAAKLVCPIYKPKMTIGRWLGLWCRYLLFKSRGTFAAVFSACRGAVRTRVDMSQFLLPYLILDVLVNPPLRSAGDSQEEVNTRNSAKKTSSEDVIKDRQAIRDELVLEICTVLNSCINTSASSGDVGNILQQAAVAGFKRAHDASSHMAVQAVFSLLDTLAAWRTEGPVGSGSSCGNSVEWLGAGQCIDEMLAEVPKDLLGRAAVRIGAHARGLRYFEILSREEHFKACSADIPAIPQGDTEDSQSVIFTRNSMLPTIKRNDCANGSLPRLSVSLVDYMMEIFARIDDADSLQGVEKLRQVYGHPSSSYNRLLEMEHTDQWIEALNEYDSLNMQHRNAQSGGLGALMCQNQPPMASLAFIERGRMRCLFEMGQLESILDQASGITRRIPDIAPALLPSAISASWQLQQWDTLDVILGGCEDLLARASTEGNMDGDRRRECETEPIGIHQDDRFEVSVGYLMSCLNRGDVKNFSLALEDARIETMSGLSTACMESYNRAYPYLVRLHILREAECSFEVLHSPSMAIEVVPSQFEISQGPASTPACNRNSHHTPSPIGVPSVTSNASTSAIKTAKDLYKKRFLVLRSWCWEERLAMLSPSVRHRAPVLALRRGILQLCGMYEQVAENWLCVSEMMRKIERYDTARVALKNAVRFGLGDETALIQESILVKDSGNPNRALMLLEPVELDVLLMRQLIKSTNMKDKGSGQSSVSNDPSVTVLDSMTEDQKHSFAHRLLLTAKWMATSHLRHGRAIIDRYKLALDLHNQWELAVFEMAQYYNVIMEARREELGGTVSPGTPRETSDAAMDDVYLSNCVHALEMYMKSVMFGHEHLMQALPRMLTIWFNVTSCKPCATGARSSYVDKVIRHITKRMASTVQTIPPHTWFVCLPQIVSRIGHNNVDTVGIIQNILVRVLVAFPEQGIWYLSSLCHSLNAEKRESAGKILRSVGNDLLKSGNRKSETMIMEASSLFHNLIEVAKKQTGSRQIRVSIGGGVTVTNFLVPSQAGLTICYPPINRGTGGADIGDLLVEPGDSSAASAHEDMTYFPTNQIYIHHFHDIVDVMPTKAKPKRIKLETTCGKTIRFLLKQERNGDLRKDARMMEFNAVVNRLMEDDPESRKRKLRLRTYAVVCLNEECGILEWVPNTTGFRNIIHEISASDPTRFPTPNVRDIKSSIDEMQRKYADNIDALVKSYYEVALKKNRPCLHQWFIRSFSDPTHWLDARVCFTRSCAVWSAVGHVLGLGDRHGENIMLDTVSAECVHVDFDCIFDKGLSLARPEIVPFRLTPNMVDAFGLTGVEGSFRRSMEVSLCLLRTNKDTLMSVLEPFIRDPTVAWGRGGHAQRGEDTSSTTTSRAGASRSKKSSRQFEDSENENAAMVLRTIKERLDGMYNIRHPNAARIVAAYQSRKEPLPCFGLGCGVSGQQEDMLALSISGQVNRLIEEATAEANLAQMFIGWMPWL